MKNFFKRKQPVKSLTGKDLLYKRRLKRSAEEEPSSFSFRSSLTGRIFIAVLTLVFVAAPFKAAMAAAFLTLSRFSGNPGAVQVSGGGFTPGETVSIYLGQPGSSPAATATVGSNTLFSPVTVTIPPNASQGELSIIGVGSGSGQQVANSFYVVPFSPSVSIVSTANTPGSTIVVSGTGFAPNETVDLSFDAAAAGSVKADGKGSFSKTNITVPNVESNTYLIHAKGQASGAETVGYFYVGGFYPTASPDNYFLMPGEALTFSGGGFAPGENIQVFEGQNQTPSAAFVAGKSGGFINAGKVAIPVSAGGGVLNFTLKSSVTNANLPLMVTVGSLTALVTPDNYFVGPGQNIKFYGKGFAPNETIQVYQGQDLSPVAAILADKNGGFAGAGTTTIPFSAAGSTLPFKFVGQQSQVSDTISISIGTFNAQISPSEYYLTPGKTFTVWGTGFAPNEKIAITAADATVTVTADKFGVFKTSGPFTAPFTANTEIGVSATGQSSGVKASLTLTVGSLSPLVTPDNYYIIPGDQVKLYGSGFGPGEDVTIYSGQDMLDIIATDRYGSFTNQFVSTPFSGGQSMDYTFVGAKSGASANLNVTIAQLHPLVSLDKYYAVPGSIVRAQGSGFSRGEPVTVKVSGGGPTFTTTASASGTTPYIPVTLPLNLLEGSIEITFTGDATGVSGNASVGLAPFDAQVYPDTWYTKPGTKVNFSGSGFAQREGINITLNGAGVGTASSTSSGEFTFSHTIPITASAVHYTFTGSKSNAQAVADISLAPFNPQVYPSSYYAAPGTGLTFNGSGFAPGETVSISPDNGSAQTVKADAKGEFISPAFIIPFNIQNAHFTFTGSLTNASLYLDIGVATLNPGIILSTYYGVGGAPLAVTGMGFGGNETISIAFDGQVLGHVTTNVNGDFTFKSAVPYGAAGSHAVTATGQSSGVSSSASFTQSEIYTNVQLGSYAGAPGSAVNFIGSGFLPNEPVEVTTDRTGSAVVYTFNANAKGNFNNSGYLLPASFTGGPLQLTVRGKHSLSSTDISYYVTGQ